MFQNRKKTVNTYGVIGLGRFGFSLAMELIRTDADLIVLDRDEGKVRQLREYTENAYVVSSLDKNTLSDAGIQNCDIVILCISEQLDTSILTTLNLVSLGVPTVIAKAASQEHGEILEKLGAEVVYPERDMAIRLAHRLEASLTLDYIQLSETLNISKVLVPEKLLDKTVVDANLRGEFGVNIIAVENNGNLIEIVEPGYRFRQGDVLYLCGRADGLKRLCAWAE